MVYDIELCDGFEYPGEYHDCGGIGLLSVES